MRIPLQYQSNGDSTRQRISFRLVTTSSLLAFLAILTASLSFHTSAQLVSFTAPPESIQIPCDSPSCGPNQQVFLSRESHSEVQQFYQPQAGPFETSRALPTRSSSRSMPADPSAKDATLASTSDTSIASSSGIIIDWKLPPADSCAGPLFANLRSMLEAFPSKQQAFASLCDRYGYLDSAYFQSVPATADTPDSLVPADQLIASRSDEHLLDSLASSTNSARELVQAIQLAMLALDTDQVVSGSQKLAVVAAEIQTTCDALWNEEAQKLENASHYAYRTRVTIPVVSTASR